MTPPPEPRSVRRRNLREDVADRLRNDILTGRLTPGKRIDQDQLAAELGVSQLPVREALIQLDQEGLVETIARRGSYVPQLTPEDIADQYRIFGLVSGLALYANSSGIYDIFTRGTLARFPMELLFCPNLVHPLVCGFDDFYFLEGRNKNFQYQYYSFCSIVKKM
jgi:hypothetical protein